MNQFLGNIMIMKNYLWNSSNIIFFQKFLIMFSSWFMVFIPPSLEIRNKKTHIRWFVSQRMRQTARMKHIIDQNVILHKKKRKMAEGVLKRQRKLAKTVQFNDHYVREPFWVFLHFLGKKLFPSTHSPQTVLIMTCWKQYGRHHSNLYSLNIFQSFVQRCLSVQQSHLVS